MNDVLTCPKCHADDLDVHAYESMMVLAETEALFTVRCPRCSARVSSIRAIPADMLDAVQCAAIEIGAGMGRSLS